MRDLTPAFTALLLAASLGSAPASATELDLGVDGEIEVHDDMGACGTVVLRRPGTAVGTFTAAGAVTGPGTAAAPVRGASLVLVTGTTWYGCLPDAYAGASAGAATYQLSVTTGVSDYVAVLTCVVRAGVVTCR